MQLNICIDKIEKKNHGQKGGILFVNVNNTGDLKCIEEHFSVSNEFINIADGMGDSVPTLYDVLQKIGKIDDIAFIEGISAYFRMKGKVELDKAIQGLIGKHSDSNVIILLYQCEDILSAIIKEDSRLSRFIFLVDGEMEELPKISFVSKSLANVMDNNLINGIEELIQCIEHCPSRMLSVLSNYSSKDFVNSNYMMEDIDSVFNVIRTNYLPELTNNDEKLLTSAQWMNIANGCKKYGSFNQYFVEEIGNIQNLKSHINLWQKMGSDKRILLFLMLKLRPSTYDSNVLRNAVKECKSIDDLIKSVYQDIYSYDNKKSSFWDAYDERKELLAYLGADEHVANEFCSYIDNYGDENSIYYLTDVTMAERKMIIKLIAKYHDSFTDKRLREIIRHIYGDLASYLEPYDYKCPELNDYFNTYKILKVKNYISDEFLARVEKEAVERNYNRLLPTRAEKVQSLNKKNSSLYFVDALGVEFLQFIVDKASKLKMMTNVILCRSELPSITPLNKEFIDEFKKSGCKYIHDNVKKIDEMIHSGQNEYDYSKSPYPTYLANELDEITDVLEKINAQLGSNVDRTYIISDHGASRLAVIAKKDARWEMVNKGEHNGRCCKKSDDIVDEPNEYMTDENGYWVLANYDIIKGSRAATVEVHGGASLEEVCVPIIEFTRMIEGLTIDVITKTVKIKRGVDTILKIASNMPIENVRIVINGNRYDAVSKDNKHFEVNINAIRMTKEYTFDVTSNGSTISKDLKFKLEREGIVINDIL